MTGAKKKSQRKTIRFAELRFLASCNSDRLPTTVEINGCRYRWVGIGWVTEGEPHGDEVLVVQD